MRPATVVLLVSLVAIFSSGCIPECKRQLIDSWQVEHDYKLVYDRLRRQLPRGDLEPIAVGGGISPAYTPFMGGTLGISGNAPGYVSIVRWDCFEDIQEARIWNSGYFDVVIDANGTDRATIKLFCWESLDNPDHKFGRLKGHNYDPAFRVDWIDKALGDWNPRPPRGYLKEWRQAQDAMRTESDEEADAKSLMRERGM
jgi:hypothetical protein